jgi:hypothetical protein
MSTAYHPQTDGQTERDNRTLEEMLRHFVEWRQTDWDDHLDVLEMAYNNSKQASTGFSPYYLNHGRDMTLPLDLAIADVRRECANPEATQRIEQLHRSLDKAKESIRKAQERQSHYADRHRRDVTFAVGDLVLLSTEHLRTIGKNRTHKLESKYIGPFAVKRVVNKNAYELVLPSALQVHPVFNVSLLKAYRDPRASHPHRPPPHDRPPAEFVLDNGEEHYEVERIVAARGRGARKEYLVEWKGYPSWEATWVRHRDIDAPDAVAEFEALMLLHH